ncbi:MAG: GTP 3',8-cyclase [Syntrophus sp. SKADARSKE-3]|nr:GTP 3',8-cyclase [Syntrophus sp. SKADARSKE-3]
MSHVFQNIKWWTGDGMDSEDMVAKGEELVRQNKLQEAQDQFLLALQSDPENKEACNNLAVIAFSLGDQELAVAMLRKALHIDPCYTDAILNLRDVLKSQNALSKVFPVIEKALALDPENDELARVFKDMKSEILSVRTGEGKIDIDRVPEDRLQPDSSKMNRHDVIRANDGFFKIVQDKVQEISSGNKPVDPLFAALLFKETFKFAGANSIHILNALAKILKDSDFLYEASVLAHRSLMLQDNIMARQILDDIIYKPPMPRSTKIEVSTYCNLRCPLCMNQKRPDLFLKREHMSLTRFKFIWERIKASAKIAILVGQGESFLNPDIYEIIELAAGDCPCVYIDTNGSLRLDHDRLVRSGLAELNYSIDGIDQQMYSKYRRKGDFNKAMDNLKKTVAAKKRHKESKLRIVWKYVVFKHNEAYVAEAEKMAADIGVDEFRLEPCGADYDNWDELVRFTSVSPAYHRGSFFSKRHGRVMANLDRFVKHCAIPSKEIEVLINGDVKFCCALDRDQVIGNILTAGSFLDIWHAPQTALLRKKILEDRFSFQPCVFCSMRQDRMDSFFWDTEFAEGGDEDQAIYNRLFPEEDRLYYDNIRISQSELSKLKAEGKDKEVDYYQKLGRIHQDYGQSDQHNH